MSAYAKLRRKRQMFVDAFVRTGSGTEAAIACGYAQMNAKVTASRIRANPEVQAAIAERTQEAIERAGLRPVRMLQELGIVALADLNNLRDEATGKVRSFKDLPAEFLRACESIDFYPDGSVRKVRIAKVSGINLSLQYLKLLTNVTEISGKDGAPIALTAVGEVSDLEKARRIAHLLAQGLRAQSPATILNEPIAGDSADDLAPSQSATSS